MNEQRIERRRAGRYSIERDVKWKWQGRRTREAPQHGHTVNISSGGVLFTTAFSLPLGKLVELGINWPVAPETEGALQLAAKGRVVRSDAGCTAVEFRQREFRGW
ncbi:MAG TPA: PilZ domain-containing protein [Bryobacteraceae bacterium]